MAYSDRDMMVATQIAYYDIPDHYKGLPLRDILKKCPNIQKRIMNTLNSQNASALEKSRAQKQLDLYNEIMSPNSEYGNWIIKDIKNDNSNTGFYGCLIETDKNSAIVGFRGSEGMHGDQLQKDWIEGDFGLLNNELTKQQAKATEFMNEINSKYNYDNYATSGHSLGGNLSAHAGITAPPDMQNKITQCYNMDGPGFSDEYLKTHQAQIDRFVNKITHYQWSMVGALLNPVPGEEYKTVQVSEEVRYKNDMNSLLNRHDTGFVEFDENCRVKDGEMDPMASAIGKLSRSIDDADAGNVLLGVVTHFINMTEGERSATIGAIVLGVTTYAVTHPIIAAAVVFTAIGIVALYKLAPEFFNTVIIPFCMGVISFAFDVVAAIKSTIETVVGAIVKGVKKLAEGVKNLFSKIGDIINGLKEWLFKHSAGYKYAQENPQIVINTTNMESYAKRLNNLSLRAKELDRNMNSYYWQLGIEWDATRAVRNLGNFLTANIVLDYAGRLDRCATCLKEIAEGFNNVENELKSI